MSERSPYDISHINNSRNMETECFYADFPYFGRYSRETMKYFHQDQDQRKSHHKCSYKVF